MRVRRQLNFEGFFQFHYYIIRFMMLMNFCFHCEMNQSLILSLDILLQRLPSKIYAHVIFGRFFFWIIILQWILRSNQIWKVHKRQQDNDIVLVRLAEPTNKRIKLRRWLETMKMFLWESKFQTADATSGSVLEFIK